MITNSHVSNMGQRKGRGLSALVGWSLIAFFLVSYAFASHESGTVWSQSIDALIMLGANYAPMTLYGQEWRLLTHIFIHSNIFHLLVNALALWAVWKRSAMVFHTGTQLYIFLVCGVISGWVGVAHQSSFVSVGASGAILGLLTSVVGWSIARSYIRHEVKKAIAGFPSVVLLVVIIASFLLPGLDVYANLGGALAGLIFGIFISSKSEKEHSVGMAIVLTGVTIALLCAAIIFARPSEEKTLRVQRDIVSEKVIESIHETDKKVEETMKILWDLESIEAGKAVNPAAIKNKSDWRFQWHSQVVQPLERNAAVAAGVSAKPNDFYFLHLNLLQQYTVSKLQEARLLERGPGQIDTVGTSGNALRQRIIELNSQMKALSKQEPSKAGSKEFLKVVYRK